MKRLLALLVFICSSSVDAQIFIGPQSAAVGGAGRAGLNGAESAFLNPALIPLLQSYELTTYFRDGQQDRGVHRNAWGVGVVDNGSDAMFPGSLHYVRLRDTGLAPAAADGELWHAAVGKAYSPHLMFGVSGYRLTYQMDREEFEQWNFSLGTVYVHSRELGAAYVVDNIARPGSDVPGLMRQSLRHSLGLFGGIGGIARARLDITRQERENPDQDMIYAMGLETASSEFFRVRVGYRHDDLMDRRIWTAGLGFEGPRLRLDYAFEKTDARTSGALHSVDLRLTF